VLGPPGKQPSFHVFLFDEMAGGDLALSLANFGEHSFLIGDVRLDGIGDQEIGASARGLGELREAFLDSGLRRMLSVLLRVFAMNTVDHIGGTETWATIDARDQGNGASARSRPNGRCVSFGLLSTFNFRLSTSSQVR
jgi:hypothetical protein